MLPARHRLRHRDAFAALRRHGRKQVHPLAVLIYVRNGEGVSRFAFTASRRVGNAVKRNRAKRLLREAVHGHLADIAPGWDCMLITRQRTTTADFAAVETAVLQLLRRANLLPGTS